MSIHTARAARAVGTIVITSVLLAIAPVPEMTVRAADDGTGHASGAARTIGPGDTAVFTTADGGQIACAALDFTPNRLPLPPSTADHCLLPRYGVGYTTSDPSTNTVWAMSVLSAGLSAIPGTATSSVYNDFTVAAERHHDAGTSRRRNPLVDAQIAVTYDFVTQTGGVSVYRDEISLALRVQDLTASLPVGTLSLFNNERTGDQGVTDIVASIVTIPVDDGSDSFVVKLRRGHSYRVYFELSTSNFGVGGARAQAQWSRLAVSVDEDDDGR